MMDVGRMVEGMVMNNRTSRGMRMVLTERGVNTSNMKTDDM